MVHAYPLHRLQEVEIKAVCDIREEALRAASQLFGCDAYNDYRELLARSDIDVVHVLTPHYLHARMTIDAANAGKHVLVEKPMATNLQDAREMIEAGKRNRVTIGVVSQNRYNSASVAIKSALEDGSLGRVIGQRVVLTWAKPADYYRQSDWRGTWDKEGGSLMIDQAIHVMDLARWFVSSEIVKVEASIANRDHPEIETEDTAEGIIVYENGVRSVFYATNNFTYNAPVLVETQCENGTALLEFDKAVITYKNGKQLTVVNDPTDTVDENAYKGFFNEESSQTAMRILRQWGVVSLPITWTNPRSYWGVSHFKQIRNFYESLAAGREPDITAEVAFKTHEMIMAVYQSAREGCAVSLQG